MDGADGDVGVPRSEGRGGWVTEGAEVILTFIRGGKERTARFARQSREGGRSTGLHFDDDHPDHGIELHEFHSLIAPDDVSSLPSKLSGMLEGEEVGRLLAKLGDKSAKRFTGSFDGAGPVGGMMRINHGNIVFCDGTENPRR